MRVILLILGIVLPNVGVAQAYKCVEGGHTTYQDAPCANVPSKAVDTAPSSSGVTGLKQDAERMAAKEAAKAREPQGPSRAEIKAQKEAQRKAKCRPGGRDGIYVRYGTC